MGKKSSVSVVNKLMSAKKFKRLTKKEVPRYLRKQIQTYLNQYPGLRIEGERLACLAILRVELNEAISFSSKLAETLQPLRQQVEQLIANTQQTVEKNILLCRLDGELDQSKQQSIARFIHSQQTADAETDHWRFYMTYDARAVVLARLNQEIDRYLARQTGLEEGAAAHVSERKRICLKNAYEKAKLATSSEAFNQTLFTFMAEHLGSDEETCKQQVRAQLQQLSAYAQEHKLTMVDIAAGIKPDHIVYTKYVEALFGHPQVAHHIAQTFVRDQYGGISTSVNALPMVRADLFSQESQSLEKELSPSFVEQVKAGVASAFIEQLKAEHAWTQKQKTEQWEAGLAQEKNVTFQRLHGQIAEVYLLANGEFLNSKNDDQGLAFIKAVHTEVESYADRLRAGQSAGSIESQFFVQLSPGRVFDAKTAYPSANTVYGQAGSVDWGQYKIALTTYMATQRRVLPATIEQAQKLNIEHPQLRQGYEALSHRQKGFLYLANGFKQIADGAAEPQEASINHIPGLESVDDLKSLSPGQFLFLPVGQDDWVLGLRTHAGDRVCLAVRKNFLGEGAWVDSEYFPHISKRQFYDIKQLSAALIAQESVFPFDPSLIPPQEQRVILVLAPRTVLMDEHETVFHRAIPDLLKKHPAALVYGLAVDSGKRDKALRYIGGSGPLAWRALDEGGGWPAVSFHKLTVLAHGAEEGTIAGLDYSTAAQSIARFTQGTPSIEHINIVACKTDARLGQALYDQLKNNGTEVKKITGSAVPVYISRSMPDSDIRAGRHLYQAPTAEGLYLRSMAKELGASTWRYAPDYLNKKAVHSGTSTIVRLRLGLAQRPLAQSATEHSGPFGIEGERSRKQLSAEPFLTGLSSDTRRRHDRLTGVSEEWLATRRSFPSQLTTLDSLLNKGRLALRVHSLYSNLSHILQQARLGNHAELVFGAVELSADLGSDIVGRVIDRFVLSAASRGGKILNAIPGAMASIAITLPFDVTHAIRGFYQAGQLEGRARQDAYFHASMSLVSAASSLILTIAAVLSIKTGPIGLTAGVATIAATRLYSAIRLVEDVEEKVKLSAGARLQLGVYAFIEGEPDQATREELQRLDTRQALRAQQKENLHRLLSHQARPLAAVVYIAAEVQSDYVGKEKYQIEVVADQVMGEDVHSIWQEKDKFVDRELATHDIVDCSAGLEKIKASSLIAWQAPSPLESNAATTIKANLESLFPVVKGVLNLLRSGRTPEHQVYADLKVLRAPEERSATNTTNALSAPVMFQLGDGNDRLKALLNQRNIIVMGQGSKDITGGDLDDEFVLETNPNAWPAHLKSSITLRGGGGQNTLMLAASGFAQQKAYSGYVVDLRRLRGLSLLALRGTEGGETQVGELFDLHHILQEPSAEYSAHVFYGDAQANTLSIGSHGIAWGGAGDDTIFLRQSAKGYGEEGNDNYVVTFSQANDQMTLFDLEGISTVYLPQTKLTDIASWRLQQRDLLIQLHSGATLTIKHAYYLHANGHTVLSAPGWLMATADGFMLTLPSTIENDDFKLEVRYHKKNDSEYFAAKQGVTLNFQTRSVLREGRAPIVLDQRYRLVGADTPLVDTLHFDPAGHNRVKEDGLAQLGAGQNFIGDCLTELNDRVQQMKQDLADLLSPVLTQLLRQSLNQWAALPSSVGSTTMPPPIPPAVSIVPTV